MQPKFCTLHHSHGLPQKASVCDHMGVDSQNRSSTSIRSSGTASRNASMRGWVQKPFRYMKVQPCSTHTACGVALRHAVVDRPAQAAQVVQFAAGRRHFDERVGRVEVVGAERAVCSSMNSLAIFAKQRIERVEQVRLPFDPVDLVQLCVGILLGHGRRARGR